MAVSLEEGILRALIAPADSLVDLDTLDDSWGPGRCFVCWEDTWGISAHPATDQRICPACCWAAHQTSEEPVRPAGRMVEVVVDAAGNPRWDIRRWRA